MLFRITLALGLTAQAVAAQDAALLLGNTRYDQFDRVSGAGGITQGAEDLRELGFVVDALNAGRETTVRSALQEFAARASEAERVIVGLAGRFVTDGNRTWFLLTDAEYPTLFSAGAGLVSVESLLAVLATRPGQALLVLGRDVRDDDDFGPYLSEGIGALNPPQGVTILTGAPRDVADFVRRDLPDPMEDVLAAARDRDLVASGFVPQTLVLMPDPNSVEPSVVDDEPSFSPVAEQRAWAATERADSAEAYRIYLETYPDGPNADEAQDRLAAILAEPNRAARLTEESLSLNRSARREIQRDLTLLGFNTRGVDGIFGPGSRAAIQNWQQDNGYPQTSYLTREQIARLDGQAVRRQAEIAAAQAEEQEAQARADRAFWEETGARGDESGYRAYLESYPNGIFASIAADAIAGIEAQRRAQAEAADRTAWDKARAENSEPSYRTYLRDFPEGAFVTEAQAALALVTRGAGQGAVDEAAIERARAQERALRLNPITARLVEAKLASLRLNPGQVDGRFDQNTRRAIRSYQEARNLPQTGFLNEATVVRLLADSINDLRRN